MHTEVLNLLCLVYDLPLNSTEQWQGTPGKSERIQARKRHAVSTWMDAESTITATLLSYV